MKIYYYSVVGYQISTNKEEQNMGKTTGQILDAVEKQAKVANFFSKLNNIGVAANEMSSILSKGVKKDTMRLSSIFADKKEKRPNDRNPDKIRACQAFMLGHVLILNGLSPDKYISKKGKAKKNFNPLKKKSRESSILWKGEKYRTPSSITFRSRFVTAYMTWLVSAYPDLVYALHKSRSDLPKKYRHVMNSIMDVAAKILEDGWDVDDAQLMIFQGALYECYEKDMGKKRVTEATDAAYEISKRVKKCIKKIANSDASITDLMKGISYAVAGGNAKVKVKSKKLNSLSDKETREVIIRMVGDAVLSWEKKRELSPIYLSWRISAPKIKCNISDWASDPKLREGACALAFLSWISQSQPVKCYINGILLG